jgi:hypothetical protein
MFIQNSIPRRSEISPIACAERSEASRTSMYPVNSTSYGVICVEYLWVQRVRQRRDKSRLYAITA